MRAIVGCRSRRADREKGRPLLASAGVAVAAVAIARWARRKPKLKGACVAEIRKLRAVVAPDPPQPVVRIPGEGATGG